MCTWPPVLRSALLPALLVPFASGSAGCAAKKEQGRDAVRRDAGDTSQRAPAGDDCALALANMRRVLPDQVKGDETDRQLCAAMPNEVIVCLQTVTTPAEADRCVHDYAARHGGPDVDTTAAEPATRAACERAVAHARGLLPEGDRKAVDAEARVEECARLYTTNDVKCLLAATTVTEADGCVPADE